MALVSTSAPLGAAHGGKRSAQKAGLSTSGMLPAPSSAQGVLALLQEDNTELQAAALMQLKDLVEVHWMELADALPDMCVRTRGRKEAAQPLTL